MMRKIDVLAIAFLLLTIGKIEAQCTAQDTFSDDFETYSAGSGQPLPDCWSAITTATNGTRNTSGDAHSGTNYIFVYTFFAVGNVTYLVSPEISTIDGQHYADFFIKTNYTNVEMEYGTMSDNTDESTFISVGSQTLSDAYQEINTGNITANTGHKYFAIKLTSPSWHTAIYIDDFSWNTSSSMDVSDVESEAEFSFFPNPMKDFLQIKSDKKIANVALYNMNGKLIYQNDYQSNQVKINTQFLTKGIYIVKVLMNNKTKYFKVIKE